MSYSEENGQVVPERFRIHYTLGGAEDSFDIEAESLEKVREIAGLELHRRGALFADCWSEDLNRLNSGNPNYTPYQTGESK